MNTIIDIARMYAIRAHKGQTDDTGADYFLAHVQQVADVVALVTNDPEIIAAAYLHDTIEDTKTTLFDLHRVFGPRVAAMVYELTHDGSKTTGWTFPRLKSRDAILVKFADRLSNLSRMEAWDEKRRAHYLKKSQFWNDGKRTT